MDKLSNTLEHREIMISQNCRSHKPESRVMPQEACPGLCFRLLGEEVVCMGALREAAVCLLVAYCVTSMVSALLLRMYPWRFTLTIS